MKIEELREQLRYNPNFDEWKWWVDNSARVYCFQLGNAGTARVPIEKVIHAVESPQPKRVLTTMICCAMVWDIPKPDENHDPWFKIMKMATEATEYCQAFLGENKAEVVEWHWLHNDTGHVEYEFWNSEITVGITFADIEDCGTASALAGRIWSQVKSEVSLAQRIEIKRVAREAYEHWAAINEAR